jgi:hypothetical protein
MRFATYITEYSERREAYCGGLQFFSSVDTSETQHRRYLRVLAHHAVPVLSGGDCLNRISIQQQLELTANRSWASSSPDTEGLKLPSESVATLPPFGPIEGQKWFDRISGQWESQKNRFALIYFGKIRFLPPCIWSIPFVTYSLRAAITVRTKAVHSPSASGGTVRHGRRYRPQITLQIIVPPTLSSS